MEIIISIVGLIILLLIILSLIITILVVCDVLDWPWHFFTLPGAIILAISGAFIFISKRGISTLSDENTNKGGIENE